ncbi:hypothetical protein POM88_020103 [Heracleum sosnowskyi]|uniref:Uncharacterized protein n=1 Tax=Heracleum sosnowskyi TaxID=360622 RepID=A0AAD8MSH6_9APIA|nr:hypothetical protein POM88_020103 [Heracleum sosnowskyi]
MAYTFTKRIFQIYSEFGHHIRIYTRVAEFPDWTFQSSNFGSTMCLDLPPNVSRDYLAMILCFTLRGNNDLNISTYSVKNTTSKFIWNYSFLSHYHESLIVILPSSSFSVRDGDQRIEITSNSEICGSHLLYRADVTGMDEYNSSTFIAEDNRSCPSKRSKHLEK